MAYRVVLTEDAEADLDGFISYLLFEKVPRPTGCRNFSFAQKHNIIALIHCTGASRGARGRIMIREIKQEDIPACVAIIRRSFMTVAEEFGVTEENAPRFTAFATTEERLLWQMENEERLMFVDEEAGVLRGYYSLLLQENKECELNNLAVLPEYRHLGIGGKMLKHAHEVAREKGCRAINIGIVEENVRLRKWYEENGAVHLGTHKFEFFPFTCGYMKWEV